MKTPRVSIIIPNYNYGRFVADAVESALAQRRTGLEIEVVVVDDGSTDESRDVLARYRDDVTLIEKPNEGQLLALNVGVDASTGHVVCILDADDLLLPHAVETFRQPFGADPTIAKVHWPVQLIAASGELTGRRRPVAPLGTGDFLPAILERGPDGYPTPPTSGNAWDREFLESVLPFEHRPGRASADGYLSMLAPLHGPITAIPEPLSQYRVHRGNVKSSMSFDALLDRNLELWEWRAEVLVDHCRRRGITADPQAWRRNAWIYWLDDARRTLRSTIPADEPFLLLDESQWGMNGPWRAIPFLEREGMYAGPPADDREAVAEIQRQVANGVGWLALSWPAHWYIDHYPALADVLASMTTVFSDDRIRIYRMASE